MLRSDWCAARPFKLEEYRIRFSLYSTTAAYYYHNKTVALWCEGGGGGGFNNIAFLHAMTSIPGFDNVV
jgi:hypothetical protein